jgi:drug/metabolite transporter (DMT)-like permease
MIAGTYALYVGAARTPDALVPLYALAGLGAGAVVLTPIVMVRLFPSPVRFSGVSLSYNVPYALIGGLTPLLVAWLSHFDRMAPAHYVVATIFIGAVAMLAAPLRDRLEA